MPVNKGNTGAAQGQERGPVGTHYLRAAHIDAFGSILQRDLGPYTPGLNLVYGLNEAGKTTTSTFIGGVLFGWPEARGGRNAYRPAGGHRSGTLVFAPRPGVEGMANITCSRARNAEGIKPDPEPAVLDDIDADTYRTVFSINSEELLGLGGGSDVTAHLLTAGSGTAVSPARVLEQIDDQITACHSRSANYPDSIPNLQEKAEHIAAALDVAAQEAETFKKEAREYAELGPQIAEATNRLAALNSEIDVLSVQTAAIEQLEDQRVALDEQQADLASRAAELAVHEQDAHRDQPLSLSFDETRLRSLRAELEDMAVKQSSLESELDRAQEEYARAKVAYSAAVSSGDYAREQKEAEAQRRNMTILVSVVPAVFAICAVVCFVLSQNSESVLPLVAAAIFFVAALAVVGAAFLNLTRTRDEESPAQAQLDAAKHALDEAEQHQGVCAENLERHAASVKATLDARGLAQADGNIRYARDLVDDTRDAYAAEEVRSEKRAHLASDTAAYEQACERNAADLENAYRVLGLPADTPVRALKERMAQLVAERADIQEKLSKMNARSGQLVSELERAQHLGDFDALKLEGAQVATRMADAQETYARLLLERRLLAQAIEAWEGKSQPEVYLQASRLLSLMTEGAWTHVVADGKGSFIVRDEFGNEREPTYLSTGTCQQLYLALRIALLMTAENVGRSIPVVADDILVNFDAQRRKGAARALEELARVRQVIMFTCHEEVVRLMQETCQGVNLIEL